MRASLGLGFDIGKDSGRARGNVGFEAAVPRARGDSEFSELGVPPADDAASQSEKRPRGRLRYLKELR